MHLHHVNDYHFFIPTRHSGALNLRITEAILLLIIIVITACAKYPTVPERNEEILSIDEIQYLISERRFSDVISSLNATSDQLDGKRRLLLAECYFRIASYEKALKHFELLLTDADSKWNATHRSWASRLMLSDQDNAVKQQIQKEMQSLQRGENNLDLWWTLYHGYRYLHNSKGQTDAIQQLAQLAETPEARTDISAVLLEESLHGNRRRQEALTELYLHLFPHQSGLYYVTRLWLNLTVTPSSEENTTDFSEFMERYPENRFLALEIAGLSSAAETLSPIATQAIMRYQRLRKQLRDIDIDSYENSRYYFFYGRILLKQGELSKADSILSTIVWQDEAFPQSKWLQAEIAFKQGDVSKAITFSQQAKDAGIDSSQVKSGFDRWLLSYGVNGGFDTNSIHFDDVTRMVGMANIQSESIAWGDFDGDGRDDLLLDGPRLLRNTLNGFIDETTRFLKTSEKPSTGGLWLDVDNDGNLDVLIWGRYGAQLYVQRHGRFKPDPQRLDETLVTGNVSAIAAADMDQDGDLDLYVARYELPAVERGICLHDQLLENLGDQGFADVTRESLIFKDEPYCGRGVIWTDLNQDSRPDVLVSNYRLDPNTAWIRTLEGTYTDQANELGLRGNNVNGYYGHSIGADIGDVDENGFDDIYLTNLAHPRYLSISDTSMLLMRRSDGYTDNRVLSGIRFEETNADPALGDINNDSHLDLYVSSIYPHRFGHLWLNNGQGKFKDITSPSGTRMENGWATAFNDYNNDGRLDLLVASTDGIRLFRNRSKMNHWLSLNIDTMKCNRFGVGSNIHLYTKNLKLLRSIHAGKGTGTQQGYRAHFGLGDITGPVRIVVEDICGGRTEFETKKIDRTMQISY